MILAEPDKTPHISLYGKNLTKLNILPMENIILHEIDMGIMKGKHYKEIYKDCKERLETVKDLAYLEAV